jgi:hypothetical protein
VSSFFFFNYYYRLKFILLYHLLYIYNLAEIELMAYAHQ